MISINHTYAGQPSWISIAATAVSVIGWIIVFRQAMFIKHRDDIKNIIDNAKITVDDIFELSKNYYLENDDHIGFASSDIKSRFLLLSHYILLLKSKGVDVKLSPYVISFRKAIMGDYFETLDFKKQMEIPDRRSDITNGRSELNFRIEKTYVDWARKINFSSQFFTK